jgi:hypothetical protein
MFTRNFTNFTLYKANLRVLYVCMYVCPACTQGDPSFAIFLLYKLAKTKNGGEGQGMVRGRRGIEGGRRGIGGIEGLEGKEGWREEEQGWRNMDGGRRNRDEGR